MGLFTSREDLETKMGAQRVLDFFDDDRDGTLGEADLERLESVVSEADDTTTGILIHKGWERTELKGLSRDRALRRASTQIAMQLAAERRPEFQDAEGKSPYDFQGERGRKFLKEFASGAQRSRLEDAHGKNASLRGRVSASTPNTIFGRDTSDPDDAYGDGRGF